MFDFEAFKSLLQRVLTVSRLGGEGVNYLDAAVGDIFGRDR